MPLNPHKFRLTHFIKSAATKKAVPLKYYVIEFFNYVICGIDFYRNYRRFYERHNQNK